MLPASVLTRRTARSHRGVVAVGARWFRRPGARNCAAPVRPAVPNGRHYAYAAFSARPGGAGGRGNGAAVRVLTAGYCSSSGAKKTVPFLLADIGEGISEVTVKEWYVNAGDRITEFDDVCEVESDKAAVTITSRYTGTVTKLHHEAGSTVRVGSALVDMEVEDEAGEQPSVVVPVVSDDSERPSSGEPRSDLAAGGPDDRDAGKVLTTPAVRRIAAEKSIDLATVRGTGKHGRVLKEDLLDLERPFTPIAAASGTPAARSTPAAAPADYIPLTGYDKAMRNTMEISNKIPTLVITDEVDLTRLIELKTQISERVKVTLFPFLVKASSLALTLHPRVNCTPSSDYGSYRLNEAHNIGVAIDTPLGLAVPNIKNVQTLTVMEVAGRLAELRAKAVVGKLGLTDVTGGTFTLSNMGSIAGSAFRPVILPHEAAIGALGRLKYRARYDAQERLVRTPVMDVSWAADHRILDGAAVARFFKDWKTYVENPSLILAGVKLEQ
ncbi:E3-binding domain,Biotin/lipoyl attachment,Single hybrid motif,2-oxo acid dehydrogenase [Cinara cedri]|uniref:Dihydrolipoamide acetyltransferase component of pyruvate dehydrogenase complex n=1 Tax=Cinara cedri TaxID=506608 RepID=A0A5E4MR01_9HEMI|nr:E3-binding domain,Biotin/lipoyl attachment,Single hybrid motif,2-oxo acid dehydrogenase [Cinara cedri]